MAGKTAINQAIQATLTILSIGEKGTARYVRSRRYWGTEST